MGLNPNDNTDTTNTTRQIVGLEGATVIDTESHTGGDNVAHEVKVKPDTLDSTLTADVAVGLVGDVTIPEVGNKVIIGYRVSTRPIVLGTRYKESDTVPDFEPGERRIGHPASDGYIRMKTDGTMIMADESGHGIELTNDGNVHIYGNVKQHTSKTLDT